MKKYACFCVLLLLISLFASQGQAVTRLYDRNSGEVIDADKDDAEWDNTNNEITTHEADTAAHGVTGNNVGTAGAQTLTGPKTLVSPIITTSPTAAGATWTNLGTVTTMVATSSTLVSTDINGGTIDAATIGATTPAAGTFSDGAMYGQPLVYSKTLILPEYIQDETDTVAILPVETGWAPNGILITKFGIKTNASSTYSVVLEDWTSATSGSSVDIFTVATSSTSEAESGALTTTVTAGDIVFIDLPTTTGLKWLQIWFNYEIKGS